MNKFYDRKTEMATLEQIENISHNAANMAKLSEKVEIFKTIVKSEINGYGMRISGLSMEDM